METLLRLSIVCVELRRIAAIVDPRAARVIDFALGVLGSLRGEPKPLD